MADLTVVHETAGHQAVAPSPGTPVADWCRGAVTGQASVGLVASPASLTIPSGGGSVHSARPQCRVILWPLVPVTPVTGRSFVVTQPTVLTVGDKRLAPTRLVTVPPLPAHLVAGG